MATVCKYSASSHLPWFTDVYTCEVEKISTPPKWSFEGCHEDGKTDDHVKYFRIKNKQISAFPMNLGRQWENLVCLKLDACCITKISRKDLYGLRNLEVFDLCRNLLTALPDNLFSDTKKLRGVWFKSNKLERLSSKLLVPIAKTLELANFEDNVKINDRFNIKVPPNNNLKDFMKIIDQKCSAAGPNTDNVIPDNSNENGNDNVKQILLQRLADINASAEYRTVTVTETRGKVDKCMIA